MDAVKEAVKEMGTLDIILLALSCYIIWKLVISKLFAKQAPEQPKIPELPPMKKRDMTVEELSEYDGIKRSDGRILIACDGKIFDVTKAKKMYGKDGPYGIFAGRDASRGLATFTASAEALRDTYDDLSDLNQSELEGMREWAMQFSEKYPIVGRLLKPGDAPDAYTDEENEKQTDSASFSGSITGSTNSSVQGDSADEKKDD